MITLITGIPGTGKTAYAVKTLLEISRERPIFSNINGLKIDHFPIDAEWIKNWDTLAPADSVIVIDECQHHFPPRSTQSKPPQNVAAFNTHRHMGVDFILITQRANLIDYSLKGLVERHIHIRKTALTRMIHEAPEVVDFSEKSVRSENATQPYKLPKDVFSLYKSSELHTKKQRARLPAPAIALMALIPIIGGLSFYAYSSVADKMSASDPGRKTPAAMVDGSPATEPQGLMADAPVRVPVRMVEALTPTDAANHLSAPLYAPVAPPVVVPEIVGCIASRTACTCYTQQSTPQWMPDEQCRQRAAGEYFDPYRQPPPQPTRLARSGEPPNSSVESKTLPPVVSPPAQAAGG